MKILVTGGAGYIGSFMVKALLDKGDDVTVFDNLSRGHESAIDKRANFLKGDITDESDLNRLLENSKYDAAIHFAGLIAVGESEQNPELYYKNNVIGSKLFFEACISKGNIKKFIFSSSAAVYGNPLTVPIPEDHPKKPTSKYGENKLEIEEALTQIRASNNDVSFVALRYFNAAGAALDGSMGEDHNPETHIIPNIVKAIKNKQSFKLFGSDYNTKDGTCVRDYIHVLDLVEAHILALDKLNKDKGGYFYNVGTGNGYSNREVVEMVKKISGEDFPVENEPRRPGDAEELVADPQKIKQELGFEPKYSDLETVVKTAWLWHTKRNSV